MPYFVIAREEPRPKQRRKKGAPPPPSAADGGVAVCGELPGFPVALIKSQFPSMAGAFLCAMKEEGVEHTAEEAREAEKLAFEESRKARLAREAIGAKDESALQAVAAGRLLTNKLRGGAPFAPDSDTDSDGDNPEEEPPDWPVPVASGSKRRRESATTADPTPPGGGAEDGLPVVQKLRVELPLGSWFEQVPKFDPADPLGIKTPLRLVQYVAASAGAGKTVYASALARRYARMWPDHPIWGVCKTDMSDDPAWEGVQIHQLPLEKTQGDLKAKFGNTGCLLIVDDWDSEEDSRRKMVLQLIKDVINLGRKMRISIIVTSHAITNYHETRDIISEAEYITLFPEATMPAHLYYMCVKKLGVTPEMFRRLAKKGRWITIHTKAPMYILSERECDMITLEPPMDSKSRKASLGF